MDISRSRPPNPFDFMPPRPDFQLASTDLTDGGDLPLAHGWNDGGVGGDNLSPHLSWSGFPPATRGFAVTCFDPDAPTGCGWWHWIVVGVRAEVTELATGAGLIGGDELPTGAYQLRNDYGTVDFGGAGPPPGDHAHRYIFTVHALSVERIDVPDDAPAALTGFMVNAHTLAKASFTATYGR